ncbi:MAG: TonB family protein [Acidobacteriia bacterium]|nr:TonB family protein [Terriglobia bacterium]
MTKPSVLLVDYDPTSIEIALGSLSRAGYDVTVAKNGVAGLEAFRHVNPDLVLTQMILPRVAGLELCREIRKTHPKGRTPILVFGTTPAEKGRSQAVAAGASGYIVAPIDPETLVDTCNEYLTGCQAEPPDDTPRGTEADGVASRGVLSDGSEPAAVTAEILERLDACLPSKRIEVEEPPSALEPTAAPPKAIQEEHQVPPPAPPRPVASPIPKVAVPAADKPEWAQAPRQAPERTGLPWGKVLAAAALGAGLLAAIGSAWVRTHPGLEARATEPSIVGRTVSSEALDRMPAASTESRPAAAAPDDHADAPRVTSTPERSTVEPRSHPLVDGSSAAKPPRPESTTKESGSAVPTTTAPARAPSVAHPVPPDPLPVPAPEKSLVPVTTLPEAFPESEEASGSSPGPVSAVVPEPTTSEPPPTAAPSSPAAIHPGDLVELGSVDAPPVAKTHAQPAYPELARRMRISGAVVLRILVDETGRVTEAAPEDRSVRQDFLAAAIRAVRTWTYSPATKNGVPVKTRITVRIAFQP